MVVVVMEELALLDFQEETLAVNIILEVVAEQVDMEKHLQTLQV
jgi:hypothetical protein